MFAIDNFSVFIVYVVSRSPTDPGVPQWPRLVQVEERLRWIKAVPRGPKMTASCHWSFLSLCQWGRPHLRTTSRPLSQPAGQGGLWALTTWSPITRRLWLLRDGAHCVTLCLKAPARWVHYWSNIRLAFCCILSSDLTPSPSLIHGLKSPSNPDIFDPVHSLHPNPSLAPFPH